MWLLEELDVPYELKTYKRGADKLADPKLKEVHPLGKSPVVTLDVPGRESPVVLAESGAIAEYLCDHYGKQSTLVPIRYQEGKDGQVGGETESWMRYRMFMHYAEGSIMPLNVISLLVGSEYHASKDRPVLILRQPSEIHQYHSSSSRSQMGLPTRSQTCSSARTSKHTSSLSRVNWDLSLMEVASYAVKTLQLRIS